MSNRADTKLNANLRYILYIPYMLFYINSILTFNFSLSKHLSSKKGSRTSNCGNRLEFSVLTLIQSVP